MRPAGDQTSEVLLLWFRDEWGKLIELQWVGRDITAHKREEENLNS
jgi:hypothetical protein